MRSKTGIHAALFLFSVILASIVLAADTGIAAPVFDFVRSFPFGDKIAHFILMGTLAFLVNLVVLGNASRRSPRAILVGTGIVVSVVLLEEVSQIWIPGRTFSFSDLIADALGIACGGLLAFAATARPVAVERDHSSIEPTA